MGLNTKKQTIAKNKGIVAAIGRWMPIHNGHKEFLIKLANEYEKIIVIIGSCYENGTKRNCIPSIEREKMIHAIFKREKISKEKYEIVQVPDVDTFEEWIKDIKEVCKIHGVTHFCTGNKEDILNILERSGEKLEFKIINPEEKSNFPYHSTDVRNLITEGKYEEVQKLIPDEINPILYGNAFKEIIAASKKRGIEFEKGRQCVDVILLIKNINDRKMYVLLGKRSMEKEDFPGYLALPGGGINKFETPVNAAIREFKEETGLEITMLDNSLEPAIIRFSNGTGANIERMHIVGIYSSKDKNIAGTKGGSSQCFGIFIEDELEKYKKQLDPKDDLEMPDFYEVNEAIESGLAYQHEAMIKKALSMFEAYPDLVIKSE